MLIERSFRMDEKIYWMRSNGEIREISDDEFHNNRVINRITFHVDNTWSAIVREGKGIPNIIQFNAKAFLKVCKLLTQKTNKTKEVDNG